MKEMFKTTDKINKAIDLIIKSVPEIENEERKEQAINLIHDLSVLHSNCFSDLTQKENSV